MKFRMLDLEVRTTPQGLIEMEQAVDAGDAIDNPALPNPCIRITPEQVEIVVASLKKAQAELQGELNGTSRLHS